MDAMQTMNQFGGLIGFAVLMLVGLVIGSYNERRHFRSLAEREGVLANLPVTNLKSVPFGVEEVESSFLVTGSAVISIDYFKRFLATVRGIFGGRVGAYESLLDRARREALLRLKEQALHADMVVNLRVETSSIGSRRGDNTGVACVEVVAYGTAIVRVRA